MDINLVKWMRDIGLSQLQPTRKSRDEDNQKDK